MTRMITVRIPEEMYSYCTLRASEAGVSLNRWCAAKLMSPDDEFGDGTTQRQMTLQEEWELRRRGMGEK